jgi:hydrogenase maturation protease
MIAVVAYGNPLRGDDGVAWRVVERLERDGDLVVPLTLHQLTPEVALVLSQADGVIFVDARAGTAPGSVCCAAVKPQAGAPGLTHHVSPEAVLALAQSLYGVQPRAALVTIAAESFALAEHLSLAVRRAVPRAVRLIRDLVRAWSLEALPEGATLGSPRVGDA